MIDKRVKVFITSNTQDYQDIEKKLRGFYERSDKKFELVESADLADVILIGDVWMFDLTQKIVIHPYVSLYPNKCFIVSHEAKPLIIARGIYSSCEKSIMRINRVRTGSYSTNPDRFQNPFIDSALPLENQPIQKRFLFSFVGRDVKGPVRKALFRQKFTRDDIYIEDSSAFNVWKNPPSPDMLERQQHYVDVLLSSKFSLCPRGWGTNSIRLYESMQLGVAPVILSDDWIAPQGPKWEQFSLRIKEKHVKELERIISSVETSYVEMGEIARKEYERYFSDQVYFNYVVKNCLDMQKHQIVPEQIYAKVMPWYLFFIKSEAILADVLDRRTKFIRRLLFAHRDNRTVA